MLSLAAQFLRRKKRSTNKVLPGVSSNHENLALAYSVSAYIYEDTLAQRRGVITSEFGPIPDTCEDGFVAKHSAREPPHPTSKVNQTFELEVSGSFMFGLNAELGASMSPLSSTSSVRGEQHICRDCNEARINSSTTSSRKLAEAPCVQPCTLTRRSVEHFNGSEQAPVSPLPSTSSARAEQCISRPCDAARMNNSTTLSAKWVKRPCVRPRTLTRRSIKYFIDSERAPMSSLSSASSVRVEQRISRSCDAARMNNSTTSSLKWVRRPCVRPRTLTRISIKSLNSSKQASMSSLSSASSATVEEHNFRPYINAGMDFFFTPEEETGNQIASSNSPRIMARRLYVRPRTLTRR